MRYFSIHAISVTAEGHFIVLHLPSYSEGEGLPTLKMLNQTIYDLNPSFVYVSHTEFKSEAELRSWQNDKERPLQKIGFSVASN